MPIEPFVLAPHTKNVPARIQNARDSIAWRSASIGASELGGNAGGSRRTLAVRQEPEVFGTVPHEQQRDHEGHERRGSHHQCRRFAIRWIR